MENLFDLTREAFFRSETFLPERIEEIFHYKYQFVKIAKQL